MPKTKRPKKYKRRVRPVEETEDTGETSDATTGGSSGSRGLGGNSNPNPPPSKGKKTKKKKETRPPPAIGWCLTCYQTELFKEKVVPRIRDLCRYAIAGDEICPTTKTPHIQGYIEFKEKFRPKSKFDDIAPLIRWFHADGSKMSNYNYCGKEEQVFFKWGRQPRPLQILKTEQLRPWQAKLVEEVMVDPDDRKVIWLWSNSGGVGKTSMCKYLAYHHSAMILGGRASDVRNAIVQYEQRTGTTPDLVVCNIPRSFNSEFLSYEAFENIKDMCFYSGKYEGGQILGNPAHLIIFANEPPNQLKMSADRWDIRFIE